MARTQNNTVDTSAADALAAKLKAARAEVKRVNKERDAATAAAHAALEELAALKAANPDPRQHAADQLSAAFNDFTGLFIQTSWKRRICGAIFAVAVAYGAGWLIGNVMGWLIAGALLLTGSMFLAWMILIIGAVCSAIAGYVLGGKAYAYIANEVIDKHVASVKNTVTGWFKRKDIVEFTGAHAVH
jgi:hypothetical protein